MKNLLILFALSALISCNARITYLGDELGPRNGEVEVFYDFGDVKKEFKVMGIMSAESNGLSQSTEDIRKDMIEKAAEKGADGIVFMNVFNIPGDLSKHAVEAKLIRYRRG